ncbi:MAG: hypothetical protein ABUK01_07855 [Leptospirales bacterium]
MIRKEDLIRKIQNIEGDINRDEFKTELKNIFEGMGDVARGFLKIAHSANLFVRPY